MYVRVVAYDTSSIDEAVEWADERAERLRSLPGVRRFDFVTQENPDRAGAIVYFESREDHDRYVEERLPEIQESIRSSSWGGGLAYQHTFEVADI